MPLAPARARVAAAYARYAQAQRQRCELAAFRTHAERAELQAAFTRHSTADLSVLAGTTGRHVLAN